MKTKDMINHLEGKGYVVTYDAKENELDNVDAPMLEEIENLFFKLFLCPKEINI